ncbi:MAG: T9SS type A sorting domain-containing protein [Ignavibacteriales bacterium]|nr:MAG: T9SS type A sorting domain-containing protein [Ignavibacteriales bacterium]
MKSFTKLFLVSFLLISFTFLSAQDNISFTDDNLQTASIIEQRDQGGYGSVFNAGTWYPSGTYPNLPAVTYFQSSVWLGDTLYVHTPSTTGGISSTIIKYTLDGSWTNATPLPASMVGGVLVACNGKLYYVAGSTVAINGTATNTLFEYTPSTGSWTSKAVLPAVLAGHGAVAWGDSVIFVVGGPYTGSGTNLNIHYYRLATDTWATISNSLPSGQGRRTFALGISGNKIIMSSGYNTAFLKTTWVGTIGSDASQLTWTAAPDVPTTWAGLSRPGGTAMGDYFFVVNGERAGAGGYYDTTHVYQISTNTWIDIINNIPFKMSNIFNAVAPKMVNDTIRLFIPGGYGSLTGATPGAGTNLFNVAQCGDLVIPVELISFYGSSTDHIVNLSWSTATETNNYGFEVQRNSGDGYVEVGFVSGYGSTSEIQHYSFIDSKVPYGTYLYRLKQIDFDGTFEYSNEIEIKILPPSVFALDQNYPNPFNPSTTISFSLAKDSRVTVKVFDVVGQEVATIVNNSFGTGSHEINFDASNLNSGVYIYRLEASAVDGSTFSAVKKMTLTK